MSPDRLPQHQRPERLEHLLTYFEQLLGPLERQEITQISPSDEPILYIMGCARCGSTLVYQYLSQSGLFTYPTNFLSRFFYAPYLGARLQEMLFDADFRNEIAVMQPGGGFDSHLGKTQGPMAPHEFWYFWQRFFDFDEGGNLTPEQIDSLDGEMFIRELRSMQAVASKPLVLKGMICNWYIPALAALDRRSYFLFVHRRLEASADSLVRARKEFFGDPQQWYSFKPPGYAETLSWDAYRQTVWQVLRTNSAIDEGLAEVATERVFRTSYEDFCENPRKLLQRICDRWERPIPHASDTLPASFTVRERFQDAPTDWAAVVRDVDVHLANNGVGRRDL